MILYGEVEKGVRTDVAPLHSVPPPRTGYGYTPALVEPVMAGSNLSYPPSSVSGREISPNLGRSLNG
jgi:hypothetical protein